MRLTTPPPGPDMHEAVTCEINRLKAVALVTDARLASMTFLRWAAEVPDSASPSAAGEEIRALIARAIATAVIPRDLYHRCSVLTRESWEKALGLMIWHGPLKGWSLSDGQTRLGRWSEMQRTLGCHYSSHVFKEGPLKLMVASLADAILELASRDLPEAA